MAEREKLLGYGNLARRGLRLAADKARPTGTQVQLVDHWSNLFSHLKVTFKTGDLHIPYIALKVIQGHSGQPFHSRITCSALGVVESARRRREGEEGRAQDEESSLHVTDQGNWLSLVFKSPALVSFHQTLCCIKISSLTFLSYFLFNYSRREFPGLQI